MQIEITLNLTFIHFQTNPDPKTTQLQAKPGPRMSENGPELIMRLEVDLDLEPVEP